MALRSTTHVTGFIDKYTEDVVPTVTVRTFPNHQPWTTGNIRTKLKDRAAEFKERDTNQALPHPMSVRACVVGFNLSPVLMLCLLDGSSEGIAGHSRIHTSAYKKSCYALKRTIKQAKHQCRTKIESYYTGSDTHLMWQGVVDYYGLQRETQPQAAQ